MPVIASCSGYTLKKTDSATSAIIEVENAMSWFRDLDKVFKNHILIVRCLRGIAQWRVR